LVLAATVPGVGAIPGRPAVLRTLLSPRRYYSRKHFVRVAPQLYGGRARTHPEVITGQVEPRLARPPSPVGYLSQVFSTWTYSGLATLHRVRAPTLVLAGDDDPIVPLANARMLARLIPTAELRVIGGGHLFLIDGTPGVGQEIVEFLSRPLGDSENL
jgi:pimeloyl-ACP methyl ester carboxylesterase